MAKATTNTKAELATTIAWLKRHATARTRDGMARYGLPSDAALGVSVADIQKLARQIGRNHDLALALWDTGIYEARLLTAFVDEPSLVTPAQMDRWCRDFDNWGVVDTVCFKLFDQSPHAWKKVAAWSAKRPEFQKRAGFVLLACLAGHDTHATDAQFLKALALIEGGAEDDRNFVKKGVSWALRMIGRRSPKLKKASLALARQLATSTNPAARWVGKDAVRDLTKA